MNVKSEDVEILFRNNKRTDNSKRVEYNLLILLMYINKYKEQLKEKYNEKSSNPQANDSFNKMLQASDILKGGKIFGGNFIVSDFKVIYADFKKINFIEVKSGNEDFKRNLKTITSIFEELDFDYDVYGFSNVEYESPSGYYSNVDVFYEKKKYELKNTNEISKSKEYFSFRKALKKTPENNRIKYSQIASIIEEFILEFNYSLETAADALSYYEECIATLIHGEKITNPIDNELKEFATDDMMKKLMKFIEDKKYYFTLNIINEAVEIKGKYKVKETVNEIIGNQQRTLSLSRKIIFETTNFIEDIQYGVADPNSKCYIKHIKDTIEEEIEEEKLKEI